MYDEKPTGKIVRSPYLRSINDGQIYPFHEVLAEKTKEFAPHWEPPKVVRPKSGATGVPQYDPPPKAAPTNSPSRVSAMEHPQNVADIPDDTEEPFGMGDLVEGSDEALQATSETRKAKKPAPRVRPVQRDVDYMNEGDL